MGAEKQYRSRFAPTCADPSADQAARENTERLRFMMMRRAAARRRVDNARMCTDESAPEAGAAIVEQLATAKAERDRLRREREQLVGKLWALQHGWKYTPDEEMKAATYWTEFRSQAYFNLVE